jgi:hypothetical protein
MESSEYKNYRENKKEKVIGKALPKKENSSCPCEKFIKTGKCDACFI